MEKVQNGWYEESGEGWCLLVQMHLTEKIWEWTIYHNGNKTSSYWHKTKKEAEKQARKHLKLILKGDKS